MTNYQEHVVKLTSTGAWTASTNDNWLELPVTTGVTCNAKDFTVRVEDNTNASPRTAKVTFRTGSKSCVLTINQAAGEEAPTGSGPLYCNTNVNANDGIYTSTETGTFPGDYYKVNLTADTNVVEVVASGSTNCGDKAYNIAFVYPDNAELQKIEIWNVLTNQYQDQPYTSQNNLQANGVNYTKIICTWTYAYCDGATNKYRLTFKNNITK